MPGRFPFYTGTLMDRLAYKLRPNYLVPAMIFRILLLVLASLGVSLPAAAQKPPKLPVQLGGTWKAETPDGPRSVVIRPDSSASYGDETVRWRLKGDSIHIAFGDEWTVYHYALKGSRLTLSGGDLEDPITLRRTGSATTLPKGVAVPPAPPDDRRSNTSPVTAGKKTKTADPTH
jgi:hypothetical protein